MKKNIPGSNIKNDKSLWLFLKRRLLRWLQLTNDTVVKVYNGYGDATQMILYGHVLKVSPLARKKYSGNWVINTFSLLRLFMVRPKPNASIAMKWNDQLFETMADTNGFFHFEWKPGEMPEPGWHQVRIDCLDSPYNKSVIASGEGLLFVPAVTRYACITDIDDTFLISHSYNLRKRLFVLLTESAISRKPFEGVVKHYQLLSKAGTEGCAVNPFFYVSSSEWNLYDYIGEFSRQHELPQGIYLLNELKRFHQVLKSGQGKHATKFVRISRIIESFPLQKYILMGDDSQEDPAIYASVAEHFPGKIFAVYLRRVKKSSEPEVRKTITRIEATGVACCYFSHSAEAIEHSQKIGLINES